MLTVKYQKNIRLMIMMKILKKLKITELFSKILTPVLAPVGIGSQEAKSLPL